MSTEEPPVLDVIPDSSSPKKKKKKKKKRNKSKRSETRIPRRNLKSYGADRRYSSRRESIPHHATVQSLASINQPMIVTKLTKMSQDLKYQRELQKALMELKQKDEDYRYAIEIGESLTKENSYLKEQCEILEAQLHHQDTDNSILKEKLETLHNTYSQDLSQYHCDLEAHKQLVAELKSALQRKQEQISHQKDEIIRHKNSIHDNISPTAMMKFNRMTSDEIQQLSSKDMGSSLEKQLFIQLEKEKKKYAESQQKREDLMRKLDDMMSLKKKYSVLKKANKELKQITKDELAQHISMQKSIEQEAVYLAARKANLEEEREDLLALLDQRDYEITILNQQLALQRKDAASHDLGDIHETEETTLGDDINNEYYVYNDGEEEEVVSDDDDDEIDDQEEIDIIAEILDDEDIFDNVVSDDDDDEGQMNDTLNAKLNRDTKDSPYKREEQKNDENRDKKAFDKIKEYLHLTASAVKIKYPTVKDIQSDQLIRRVRELPFYKYHDQMVRIMETHIKKSSKPEEMDYARRPQLQKRKSFLSIFNIFGSDDREPSSDAEISDDDKSDGSQVSNDSNDAGISRRSRRGNTRKKKSKKKIKRKSLPADKTGQQFNMDVRNARGLSVQASHQRLKRK